MRGIKDNPKLHYRRKLDQNNENEPGKSYYDPNCIKELDKHYKKKR